MVDSLFIIPVVVVVVVASIVGRHMSPSVVPVDLVVLVFNNVIVIFVVIVEPTAWPSGLDDHTQYFSRVARFFVERMSRRTQLVLSPLC